MPSVYTGDGMIEWLLFITPNEHFFHFSWREQARLHSSRWRWCPLCTSPTRLIVLL